MTEKKKSSKKKTKSSKGSKDHKALFKKMAGLISKEWKKYNGNLDYHAFAKKMWKENKHKK